MPALRKRYSIWSLPGVPGVRSRAISPGVTQPSAELVTEVAFPTTVSTGWPGALVTLSRAPSGSPICTSLEELTARTIWPGWSAQ